MPAQFSAAEVFQMATRIEENAAAFYRKAVALKCEEGELDFLLALAAMEDEHARTFSEMAQGLIGQEDLAMQFDPDNQVAAYLHAVADGKEVEGSPRAADRLSAEMSIQGIIDLALALEKEAVRFYDTLAESMPLELGKGKVERIAQMEREHVETLQEKRQAIQ